ncbi:hypothetical protein YEEN111655_01275 [Yersinia entomophaga]
MFVIRLYCCPVFMGSEQDKTRNNHTIGVKNESPTNLLPSTSSGSVSA